MPGAVKATVPKLAVYPAVVDLISTVLFVNAGASPTGVIVNSKLSLVVHARPSSVLATFTSPVPLLA